MEAIRVMEKPDWVSWENVRECLYNAQQTNVRKGFDMSFGHLSAEELCKEIGDGYCFVVLNENNKVVGTVTLKIPKISTWWHKGEAGYHCFEGVDPMYRGTDVYFDMHAALKKKEKDLGIKVLYADTAEKNNVVLKASKKNGWKQVQFTSFKGCNYYSVYFVKWMEGCPFSDTYIKFMFGLSKLVVKTLFKPGRINRFTNWIKVQ